MATRGRKPISPLTDEANYQVLSEVMRAILRVGNLLVAWGDRFAAPLGLTSARWQTLGAIVLAGTPAAAPAIAASVGVSRQAFQKQLDLLVEAGLVERVPNPAHLRSPLYQLRPTGKAVFARMSREWEQRAREIAWSLAPGQSEGARRFLSSLAARIVQDLAD